MFLINWLTTSARPQINWSRSHRCGSDCELPGTGFYQRNRSNWSGENGLIDRSLQTTVKFTAVFSKNKVSLCTRSVRLCRAVRFQVSRSRAQQIKRLWPLTFTTPHTSEPSDCSSGNWKIISDSLLRFHVFTKLRLPSPRRTEARSSATTNPVWTPVPAVLQSDKRNYSLLEAASNKGFLILSWHEQKVLRVQLKTSAVGCRTSNQLLLRL